MLALQVVFLQHKMASYESIKTLLEKYNQQHLLNHYSELSAKEQLNLLSEIENVNIPSFTSKLMLSFTLYLVFGTMLYNF